MNRLALTVVVAGLCAACGGGSSTTTEAPAGGEVPAASTPATPPVPVVREFTIPDGTSLRLDLVTPLDSDSSKVEDTVRATLREAVTVDGATVLPTGTEVTGTVTEAEFGLLQNLQGGEIEPAEMPEEIRVECPDWAAEPLRRRFGDDFAREMAALLTPPPLDLRVNPVKSTREASKRVRTAPRPCSWKTGTGSATPFTANGPRSSKVK